MNKENLLFGIIGLLAGLIISFVATNSYNRSVLQNQSTQLPPNIQQQNIDPQSQGAAMPEVAEAIEKADKEPENFDAQLKVGEMYARIEILKMRSNILKRQINSNRRIIG